MFFRRQRQKVPTLAEKLESLRQAGFAIDQVAGGRVKIAKHGAGALIGGHGKDDTAMEKAGVLIGGEIAVLLNAGYQLFLETPSGKRFPATAEQLKLLHDFEDDVKAALGLTNLYNTSLGTTSQKHLYDRVFKRDLGAQPKPWERKNNRIVPPATKGSQPL